MKRFTIALAAAGLFGSVVAAHAADWQPPGPITLMIGFQAGGGADTQARLIAEELEKRHGWKFIPQQVTGKGGSNLARKLKSEPADGTAIGIVVSETFTYNMMAARDPGYSADDFTYLTSTAGSQMGVMARSDSPFKSFGDVVSAARAGKPVKFGAMSAKLADGAYLLGRSQGVEFNTVMLKGGKAVLDALIAGDIDIGWGAGIQAKAVRAGDVLNLVSGENERLAVSPDAPTTKEIGVDYSFGALFMFAAPAGLPADAARALSAAIAEVVNDPGSKARAFIDKGFGGPKVIVGDDLRQFVVDDAAAAKRLLAESSK
ncbi:MAG: tripartite tricarboxylate transporter substrate-binding protein [Burkholderiaceae bacterium]